MSDNSKPKRIVLLDSHAILHRAFHALPDFASPKGEPTGALYGLVAMLLKIAEDLSPDYVIACFDLPDPTHRHQAFEGYKATRQKTDDALIQQINRSRDVFKAFNIPLYEKAGFEADDMLGTIAELTRKDKKLEVVIASGDMDTLQLIDGKRIQVYTLRKGIKDTVLYDEKAVKDRFGFGPELIPDYKGLRGDPSDNIPGIRGIGEKTAIQLITKFGGIEDIYKKLKKNEPSFKEAGIKERMVELLKANEEEAVFSKMLATIRRDAPIDFKLPESPWKESLELAPILDLFTEFGFRTLGARVRIFIGGAAALLAETEPEEVKEEVPESEVNPVGIALWLLQSDTTSPTLDDVLQYGKIEGKAQNFAESKAYIMKRLMEEGLMGIYHDIEMPLMNVVQKMEERGIGLDVPYLSELSKKFHKELKSIETRVYKHAGTEFNINSPRQLGDVLFDTLGLGGTRLKKTATGQRSTKESELEKLLDEHPIIADILRYRELQKLVSTYVDSLPSVVREDGKVHTTFLQAGTTTGRMGSENPNVQNIPVKTDEGKSIRRAFVASKGMKLVSIDYSQIELRIAAILSGDEKLMDIFVRGEDVHRAVASQVFRVPEDDVTSDMRRRAKVINFGILYGMGVNALRQNLGDETSRGEAQEFLNAYFHTFTRLSEYLEETKSYARKNGYTETFFGRRRHFAGIKSSISFMRASAERMAINAPIQGTQADIIRIAMVRVQDYLEKEFAGKAFMLLQVHDELVFEIEETQVKKAVEGIKKIMEGVLTDKETKGVPIKSEASVGKNWGELVRI